MSKTVEHYAGDVRSIRSYVQSLSHARTVEQVYALGLNAIFEIFRPDRAFVGLAESELARAEDPTALRAGWLSDLIIPICAGNKTVGKFMLQYDRARGFTEAEIVVAELIAVQAGAFIQRIQRQKEKDELVAMAVHELRTPLTTIIGAASLLHSEEGEAFARALAMIERNAQLQEKLIEDLLDLARVDAGKVDLHLTRLDLASVLETAIEDIQTRIAEHRPAIHADFQRPLLMCGDAQRLLQVFSNLLSNSLRFVSSDGEIRISAARAADVIEVSIADNGIGIAAEQLPFIFERFRQAHPRKSRSYDGFGLGLAIVKELVTMHGGSVSADSAGPGKGSNFIVRLPAAG